MSAQTVPAFAPAKGAALWTTGMLFLTFVLFSVVGLTSTFMQMQLISQVSTAATEGGISDTLATAIQANDSTQQLIAVLQLLFYLGTAVAFLVWFHRVHKNLPSLDNRELRYTPGWAVGGFFVPGLNLVRPFQVMREVWQGSDPQTLIGPLRGTLTRKPVVTPALVGWWWGLFIASGILSSISGALLPNENPTTLAQAQAYLSQLQASSLFGVFSHLLVFPSALVAIVLIMRITSWQEERARLLTNAQQQRGAMRFAGEPSQSRTPAPANPASTAEPRCASCNYPLSAGARFCSICGASVDSKPESPDQPEAKATTDVTLINSPANVATARQPSASATVTRCPSCNQLLSEGAKFCGNCGAKVEAIVKSACTKCGAALSVGTKYCGQCGATVAQE